MDLAALLTRAWKIVWQYKPLWALGLAIAACGGQSPISASIQFNPTFDPRGGNPFGVSEDSLNLFLRASERLTRLEVITPLVCGSLVVGLLGLAIASLAEGALVDGVGQAEKGAVNVSRALAVGRERFWPVFIVRLVIGVSLAVPILLAVLPFLVFIGGMFYALLSDTSFGPPPRELFLAFGAFFACLVPLLCVFSLVSIVFAWFEILTIRAIVIERLGALAGLRRAGRLLRANFVNVFILWILSAALQGLLGGFIGLPLSFVESVAALPALGMLSSGQFQPLRLLPLLFGGGLVWLISVALGGVVLTFFSSLWTVAYPGFVQKLDALNGFQGGGHGR
jgi:hypothetical protein